MAGGRGDHFLDVGAVAVFAGQIVNCRGNHNQAFKILATVLAMEFVDWHLLTPLKKKYIKS